MINNVVFYLKIQTVHECYFTQDMECMFNMHTFISLFQLNRVALHIFFWFYKILAWEPSSAKVTKSYSRRLPALERFYRETKVPTLVIYIDIFNTKTSINNIRKNCLNAKFIIWCFKYRPTFKPLKQAKYIFIAFECKYLYSDTFRK